MMKKALECALILTERHRAINQQLSTSDLYSNQKTLRSKQMEISQQIIQFLDEIQEFKSFILMNGELTEQYNQLINYYSNQIHTKINQYQMELDLLAFESKFYFASSDPNNLPQHKPDVEILQAKQNAYYNLIKK
jgi:hypothetical protein